MTQPPKSNFVATPESSNIQGYEYDAATKTLIVTFNGATRYFYHGVDPKLVEGFAKSKSKGSFFAQHIRNSHKHSKETADTKTPKSVK